MSECTSRLRGGAKDASIARTVLGNDDDLLGHPLRAAEAGAVVAEVNLAGAVNFKFS